MWFLHSYRSISNSFIWDPQDSQDSQVAIWEWLGLLLLICPLDRPHRHNRKRSPRERVDQMQVETNGLKKPNQPRRLNSMSHQMSRDMKYYEMIENLHYTSISLIFLPLSVVLLQHTSSSSMLNRYQYHFCPITGPLQLRSPIKRGWPKRLLPIRMRHFMVHDNNSMHLCHTLQ